MKKLTGTDYQKQITALKRETCTLRGALAEERSKVQGDFSQALVALNQLLTALHPGPRSPSVVLSYLETEARGYQACVECTMPPRGISPLPMGYRGFCGCMRESPRWYISLTKFVSNGTDTPTRTIIFKGKYETPRDAVKAAAEFLLPRNYSAQVEQLRKAVEKL